MSVGNYGHDGAWTESLGVIAPLQEMMLQSWDGSLRIFPAWPAKLAASYHNLRAEGALLVSASWSDGAVRSLALHSEKGAPCRLYSPWPGKPRVVDAHKSAVEVHEESGGRWSFATRAGESYELSGPGAP
jgi:hypothetical protein